ncbi:hypothetical protein [Microlunatus sp. GCM10028923]|uniref:hypothetical protein n=1 Tax=Microlunatus sp. GCM10028923 TaxID=3273400 RepID=UPI00361A4C18
MFTPFADHDHSDGQLGRIFFHGNPWPAGHVITEFAWTAELRPESGLWFHLHLRTADYDAESPGLSTDEDDWRSAETWTNYRNCTLSSTYWSEYPGFLVSGFDQPTPLAELPGRTWIVDPDPGRVGSFEPAIGLYLTGHDSVIDHRITFSATDGARLRLEWTGRIALSYAGDDEFRYAFSARVQPVRLQSITAPPALPRETVEQLLADLGYPLGLEHDHGGLQQPGRYLVSPTRS